MKKFLLSVAAVAVAFGASADVTIAGGFNSWSTTDNPLTLEDGVYTTTIESLTTEFKIVKDGTWLGADTPLELGTPLTLDGAGGNIVFANEVAVVNNAVVKYNDTDNTLTITGETGEAVVTYAIHGNFATGEWVTVDLTEAEGLWSYTYEALEKATGEFGIKQLSNGAQTAWYSCPNDAEYLTITGAVENLLCAKENNTNFKVEGLTGNWEFVFDPANTTLTVKEGDNTGIQTIVAENAPVVYYNLSGVQVANPQNGLFIKKQGSTVSKVLVK